MKDKFWNSLNTVYELLLGEDSIPTRLNLKKPVTNNEWEELFYAIDILIVHYSNEETVPKKLALCFVDIQNAFAFRKDFYSESDIDQFEDYGILLVEKAFELFSESNR